MRVAISTLGKFHSFDQARQLNQAGVFAGIFSGYPIQKLLDEKLPLGTVHGVPSWFLLTRLAERLRASDGLVDELNWRHCESVDRYAADHLPAGCDAFIGLSTSGFAAGRRVQNAGGVYVCDRGSTHIRFQGETLEEEYRLYGQRFRGIDLRIADKEEKEYAQADGIFVPTRYVARTFTDRGIPAERLRIAPYGVDLGDFYPEGERPKEGFEVLYVGALSIRKGIRYLLEAFDRFDHPGKRLTLVGTPLPETSELVAKAVATGRVVATGALPRSQVREHMGRSHAFVLASVEEGLALVQGQSMACGLPVIASEPTGCEDLYTDGQEGFVVPARDPAAIADRLQRLADEPGLREGMSQASLTRVQALGGWNAYGATVLSHLEALLAAKRA